MEKNTNSNNNNDNSNNYNDAIIAALTRSVVALARVAGCGQRDTRNPLGKECGFRVFERCSWRDLSSNIWRCLGGEARPT